MSLIARYKLDGNAKDSEGTAHGTAYDVTWAPSQLVDGGGEARLNGTTSRIETGIQFASETAASLPVWFRTREGEGHLIGQYDGTDGLAIEQTETGKIRLVVNGTASAEAAIYPGEYHHAVAVYDNGEVTLYLDNEAVATVSETITWAAVPVTIGARADGSATLACDVVDVRGYDQVLSEGGVEQLVNDINLGELDPNYSGYPNTDQALLYTFDNISGSTVIDEAGDNDGTLSGAQEVAGVRGKALYFDGSDQYVQASSSVLPGLTAFTVAFHIQPFSTTPNTNRHVYRQRGGVANELAHFRITDSSFSEAPNSLNAKASIGGVLRELVSPNGTAFYLDEDGWAHVAVRYDGEEFALFVNAVKIASTAAAGAVDSSSEPLFLSRNGTFGQNWHGSLDDFIIYDRGLSLSELEVLVNINVTDPFPHKSMSSLIGAAVSSLGYNPHPTPVANPTAIPRSGRSTEQGSVVRRLGHFDQRDGSGGSHLSPEGVVSRPDRQGRLSGNTTDQNGQPVSRRVRCFERKTGRIVRETWSNAAGYYQFDDLDPSKRFTVVAHDYSGTYNAVIADNAQPEVPA